MTTSGSRWVELLTSSEWSLQFLVRATAVLVVAWLLHAAFAQANPRWRVLVWRVCGSSVLIVLALTLAGLDIPLAIFPPLTKSLSGPSERASRFNVSSTAVSAGNESNPTLASDSTPTTNLVEGIDAGGVVRHHASVRPADSLSGASEPIHRVTSDGFRWTTATYLWTVWGLGMLFGGAQELVAVARLARLRRRATAASVALAARAAQIAMRMNLRYSFEVLVTTEIESPCVIGVWRPAIVLAGKHGDMADDDEQVAVLAHEIQHLKNADLAWNMLLRCVARVLWFHPLIWRVRLVHVAACDAVSDAAAADYIGDVGAYCRTLARLALRAASPLPAAGLGMARASSARRRIEALNQRLYASRLPRVGLVIAILGGLTSAGLLGTTSLIRAESGAGGEQVVSQPKQSPVADLESSSEPVRATIGISGTVRGSDDLPLVGATVQVYSAGVRVGTSPYCPTCYADCGKRTTTDKDGRYSIESLDPTLVFRLLVVADNYRPEFIKKVDPLVAGDIDVKLSARPVPDDPSRVVRGVIIDPLGKPAVGAVVEPFGCKAGSRRWWGSMPGVDMLAISDELGQFVLVCDHPVDGLDLRIEARGAARRNFELVPSGLKQNRLALEVGTTVEGRVVHDHHGVAGVTIGIAQTDRSTSAFVGTYQVGTDADGRFSLPNIPAGEALTVYGLMDSLRHLGAVVSRPFESAVSATTDLGDLPVVKANRLSGRIVLADGKAVPPRTRVMIGRPEAWDSTFVEPDAEGQFTAVGIPAEQISIHVLLRNYRLSSKNKSFDPLNRTGLKGVVRGDVDDLIVLFEPGETIGFDHSDNAKWQSAAQKHKRLSTQPLMGVTAALEAPAADEVLSPPSPTYGTSKPSYGSPSSTPPLPKIDIPPARSPIPAADVGPAKTIIGTVTDAAGKPVIDAQVWLPVQWVSSFETLTVTAHCNDQGQFRLSVPEAWLPTEVAKRHAIIWAYASGHAIGSVSAYGQMYGDKAEEPCLIELPPASDISFVATLADGKPASGAKVFPEHFKTPQAYDIVPRELAERITVTSDKDGRASLPALTREGIYNVVVSFADCGKQVFRVGMRSTDPAEHELKLRSAGRIEGRIVTDQLELTRGMFVSVETDALADPSAPLTAKGTAMIPVDEHGRFVIPEIADGKLRVYAGCDERLPVRPRLPNSSGLALLAGDTLQLDIPLEMCVRVSGVVRAKETGLPIAGVTVSVRYGEGLQGDQATTDENGNYSAYALAGDVNTQVIVLPDNFAQVGEPWNEKRSIPRGVKVFKLPPIDLAPTLTITGTLLDSAGKPMANVRINGGFGNRRYGFGKSDDNGAFSLPGVPTEIKLDKFEIWSGDDHLVGAAASNHPLVVRVQP